MRRSLTVCYCSKLLSHHIVSRLLRLPGRLPPRPSVRRFHKFVTRRVKYKAHDEKNTCEVGDVVELVEARPMSKTKRWRVLRTISKSKELAS